MYQNSKGGIMKRVLFLYLFAIIVFICQFSNLNAQTWKEMMDSCSAYQENQDYESALKWALQAEAKAKEQFGEKDTNYIASLTSIYSCYYYNGNTEKAIEYCEKSIPLIKELRGEGSAEYAQAVGNLGLLYYAIGDFNKVEPLLKEALEMRRRIFEDDDPDLATSINYMALFYYVMGRYAEAEPLYKEALEMSRRLFKGDHPDLAESINNMAVFYNDRGRYAEAEPLYKEALEMYRRLFKGDHPYLARSINNMAVFYNDRGRYAEAEPLYKEALEMSRRLFKGDHPDLARSINNMALFYNGRGRYAEAEPLYKEALEMSRRLFKGDHPDLASSINNMAAFYDGRGRYAEAEPLYKEALEMYRRLFKGDHPDLATSINNMAGFYNGRGRYAEAEPLYKEALEMSRRIFKGDHPYLAISINSMAYFYNDRGRYAEAEPLYVEGLKVYMNMLNNYFPSLSEKEKKQFWSTVSGNFERFNSFSTRREKDNPEILCNMYDIQLYSKALLFNSVQRIKSRIKNSGDSALLAQYNNWVEMREYLVKLYKMTSMELKEKGISVDSIEKAANELEKQISMESEDFKQSYEKKKVTWKSIQTLLKPDEAAVEVIRFRLYKDKRFTDTINYAFLIVTDQTEEHPEMVLLENGKQLENEYYNAYRNLVNHKINDTISYNRYWGKLNDKLKNYKKIYFSADGVYNKLNPSTLLMPDGNYLLDIQDIQQVNSTKDILLGYYQTKQESNIYNNAVLIGNPNFSLSEKKLQETARKIRGSSQEEKINEDTTNLRGISLTTLPGTSKEIKDVEQFLKAKKWDVHTYLGDMALKTVVKNVNSPRIMHIATHGFFLEDVKAGGEELFGMEENKMVENPLLRSGLFFTGADNYLKKDSIISNNEENGILTAYEAMNLNLDKTELVVLSACETGLGEIHDGEGVFGLRRAFQEAGAKTVIMSLWKVSDDATQELMSNFYKNWVSGQSKRKAFSEAQQTIRTKYSAPYYWGAFMMVGE